MDFLLNVEIRVSLFVNRKGGFKTELNAGFNVAEGVVICQLAARVGFGAVRVRQIRGNEHSCR